MMQRTHRAQTEPNPPMSGVALTRTNLSTTISLQPPEQVFHYAPLNHEVSSIRLIRVRSEKSEDGLIQCDLRHALIGDKYSCLSYVWGRKVRGEWITLNDQRFWVRRNLFNFLTYARRAPQFRETWLWIDALCIDQTTVIERNHQVQQMGQIYSGAEEVISWLGRRSKIAEFLSGVTPQRYCKDYIGAFRNSIYWDRAWITQEIVLAHRIKFMAKNSILDGKLLPIDRSKSDKSRPTILHPRSKDRLRGRSLIYLLDTFRYKGCSDNRDLIFSLLSLCGEGSSLRVDYNQTPAALAKDVLKACKQSFCLCSTRIVGDVLHLAHLREDRADNELSKLPFAKIKIPEQPLSPYHQLYYSRPCREDQCDGTDDSHHYCDDDQTAKEISLAVTLDMQYLCISYNGLVTFFVNAASEVVAFRHYPRPPDLYYGLRLESHRIVPAFDQQYCTIRLPFYLLLRIARINLLSDRRHCERASIPGVSTGMDSSVQLEMSVLDGSAENL
ncbi:heterokaryon incompatibility protein-domain-containing protein [Phaeosphaeria sp. MPI-PUGE-AT-0046c]|nr:heterokaryon incompatibility protein-domain-containing protein [Phaeosphaeria sp. MPI-PUGE-AT-0046c]